MRWIVANVVGVIAVVVVGVWLFTAKPFFGTTSTWSAVFLGDNEVFFGHIKAVDADHIKLVNVYYLQRITPPLQGQNQAAQQSQLSIGGLVGGQIQCPTDEINLNRNAALYWQDLQDASYVVSIVDKLAATPQVCSQPSTTPAPSASPSAAPSGSPAPAPSATPAGSATPAARATAVASATPAASSTAAPTP